MFQLDDAVKNWRTSMAQHGTVSPADVEELESHLRDDIEQLVGSGLSSEESFLVAAHRLGTPPALAAEFGKINAGLIWARRLFWMTAGFATVSLTFSVVTALTQWISVGAMVSGWIDSPAMRLILRLAIIIAAATPFVWLGSKPGGRRHLVDTADQLLVWGRRHPIVLVASSFALYLTLHAAGIGRNILLARLVDAETYGQEAYYSAYFSLAMAVIGPALILLFLASTYRWMHGRTALNRP